MTKTMVMSMATVMIVIPMRMMMLVATKPIMTTLATLTKLTTKGNRTMIFRAPGGCDKSKTYVHRDWDKSLEHFHTGCSQIEASKIRV